MRVAPFMVILVLAALPHQSQGSRRFEFDPAAFEAVVLEEMKATGTPGAAVALVRGGELAYARGFGVASVETQQPVSDTTLFRIGSTTKMFTGFAAVLLAGEGRLALDRPIAQWVDGLAPEIGGLTLERLLSHTAGLINEPSADGSHDDDALGQRVAGWTAAHLFAPPGDIYSYSSPGYWLAGRVIERAAGRPFADVLAERVFAPAGMARTTFRPLVALTYPMAQDHRVSAGAASVVRPYPDDVSTWPGGSMFSSARELARFAAAMLDEGRIDGTRVFPSAAVAAMHVRRSDTGTGCGYTFGLADCITGGVRTLSHYGFRSGSGSIVAIAPAARVAIVILANRAGGILTRTEAAARRMLLGIEAAAGSQSAGPPMSATQLLALAGRYANGADVLTLRATERGLVYRYQAQPEQPVRATGPNEIAIVDASGTPVQGFLVLKGRLTGDTYLSDGLSAFRRR